jgi:hypothetical protein
MKQLAFLFVAAMVALSAVSCGGSKSESTADSVSVDTVAADSVVSDSVVSDSAAVDTAVVQ